MVRVLSKLIFSFQLSKKTIFCVDSIPHRPAALESPSEPCYCIINDLGEKIKTKLNKIFNNSTTSPQTRRPRRSCYCSVSSIKIPWWSSYFKLVTMGSCKGRDFCHKIFSNSLIQHQLRTPTSSRAQQTTQI